MSTRAEPPSVSPPGGRAARAGAPNVVPVSRELLADLETPISAYLRLRDLPSSFLLESVEGPEQVARFSQLESVHRGDERGLRPHAHREKATDEHPRGQADFGDGYQPQDEPGALHPYDTSDDLPVTGDGPQRLEEQPEHEPHRGDC